jgi:DNA modification methylase
MTFRLVTGHWLEAAKAIPDNSIHCVVTSPPYWHLRNYKTPPQIWDALDGCRHKWATTRQYQDAPIRVGDEGTGFSDPRVTKGQRWIRQDFCVRCGAWRGELGQEPTPALYIAHARQCFREIWRVLRPDGSVYLNIGDSYLTTAPGTYLGGTSPNSTLRRNRRLDAQDAERMQVARPETPEGMKPGDLVGMPWMLAFALRDDGWWLRKDNVWHKTAAMPESVQGWRWERCKRKVRGCSAPNTGGVRGVNLLEARGGWDRDTHPQTRRPADFRDCSGCAKCSKHDGFVLRRGSGRTTTVHEYVFHLAKSPDYFYDSDAISEPVTGNGHARGRETSAIVATRNKRSVWTISPEPYSEDHFAAYPSELPMICIKAGTPGHGVCRDCGAPWARVVGEREIVAGRGSGNKTRIIPKDGARDRVNGHRGIAFPWKPSIGRTLGWLPTCDCKTTKRVPAVVLDPFFGRGTTGVAAARLKRDFVGCDLQRKYKPMARKNISREDPETMEIS